MTYRLRWLENIKKEENILTKLKGTIKMDSMNTFSFIRKSRPKLKAGDYFYYNINNSNYIGIVIHTHLQKNLKDNTAVVCLFLNYTFEVKTNVSIDDIKNKIIESDFLLPPIIINKRGWTNGYFSNLGNMELNDVSEILNKCCFTYSGGTIYDFNYEITKNISNAKLLGKTGLYTWEGVEALIQINFDLDWNNSVPHGSWYDPYRYYEKIKKQYPSIEIPDWYYKAEKRLFNK
jgi:hypothetical protein